MKRYRTTGPATLLALLLIATTAHAQAVTPAERDARNRAIEFAREYERAQNLVARRLPNDTLNGGLVNGGAWWTNSAVVMELGLTEDQKAKLARAFENHSRTIISNSGVLEKEEQQLARLLEAESIDHNAVQNQTNRVIQARSEVERETAAMTLEMREQLTRAQWVKLQAVETDLTIGRNRLRTQTPTQTPAPAQPGQRR